MLIKKNSIKNLCLSSIFLILFSCNNNKQDNIGDIQDDNTEGINSESKNSSVEHIFNAIPERTVIIELIAKNQIEYDPSLLNNPDNINNYTLENSQALNVGVYGTDLNIASIFEQTQETLLFLKCVTVLAKKLGINTIFGENMTDKMEANKNNRDSTLDILNHAFRSTDDYLKKNGRPNTSSFIVAGSWIEAVYVACVIAEKSKSEEIVKEIFAQKKPLKNLIDLLEGSHLNQDLSYILTDLIDIQKLFETKKNLDFSVESIKDCKEKITTLRTKIISSK